MTGSGVASRVRRIVLLWLNLKIYLHSDELPLLDHDTPPPSF